MQKEVFDEEKYKILEDFEEKEEVDEEEKVIID